MDKTTALEEYEKLQLEKTKVAILVGFSVLVFIGILVLVLSLI